MSTPTIDRATLVPAVIATGRGAGGTTGSVLTDGTSFYCASPGCDRTGDRIQVIMGHRRHCKLKGNVIPLPRAVAVVEKVAPAEHVAVVEQIEQAPAKVPAVAEVTEEMDVDVIAGAVTGGDLRRRLERNAAVAAVKTATLAVSDLKTGVVAVQAIDAPKVETLNVTNLLTGILPLPGEPSLGYISVSGETSAEQPVSRAVRQVWYSIEEHLNEEVVRRHRRLTEVAKTETDTAVQVERDRANAERARADEWRTRALEAEARFEAVRTALAGIAA